MFVARGPAGVRLIDRQGIAAIEEIAIAAVAITDLCLMATWSARGVPYRGLSPTFPLFRRAERELPAILPWIRMVRRRRHIELSQPTPGAQGAGGTGGQGGMGGGGAGGPSIGIFEDASSSSTRNANGINLGEASRGGEGSVNHDGADGVRERFVKL